MWVARTETDVFSRSALGPEGASRAPSALIAHSPARDSQRLRRDGIVVVRALGVKSGKGGSEKIIQRG